MLELIYLLIKGAEMALGWFAIKSSNSKKTGL